MNKNSTIFDRVLFVIHQKGIKNVAELADNLGYSSPQKIYRLKKIDCKPSYDILNDFSNMFDDLNLRWFITGKGEAFITKGEGLLKDNVAEPNLHEIEKLKSRIRDLEIEKKSLLMALREIGSGTKDRDLN